MPENAKATPDIEPRRPRGRPRAEDLGELEARLVRVALQRFSAQGYGATSMNEIARAARVSKTTLYSRFPSKGDLFRAIIDAQIRQTGRLMRHRGPKPKTLEAMLRIYAEQSLLESLSDEIPSLNRLISSEAARFPELAEAAWARGRVGVQQVADYIRDYAEIEEIPCRDPELAAELFISMLRGWYGSVVLRTRAVGVAEVRTWTRRMIEVFLAGRAVW